MDYLVGRFVEGHEAAAPEPGAVGPTAPDQQRRGGDGPCRYLAAGRADRVHEHASGSIWRVAVGAPYGEPTFATIRPDAVRGADLPGGEFALAAYDRTARTLLLATDRFGSLPVYYAAGDGALAFGTDFAWVAHALDRPVSVNAQGLYDYLFFGVVPGSVSIFEGVHKLPPASALLYRDGRITVARYWNPDFDDRPGGTDLREAAFAAIEAAVARRAGLRDLACFLSGGLDSSSVCGLAARHAGPGLRAFTMGFDVPDYDESRYARISARHFGLDLREQRISAADVSGCIDALIRAFPEPFGNASAVPAYLCARAAADAGVRHLLAGDGGDELFAGNERYQKQSLFNVYGALPAWLRGGLVGPLAAASRRAPGPLGKLASYVDQARVPLPDRLFSYNLLVRNDPGSVLTRDFLATVNTQAPYEYARAVYAAPPAGDALDRMLYLDWTITLTDNDLPKVRMACDLAGVNVFFPMLDPAVAEVAARVPSNEKLTLRTLRKFYKEAFAGFLPAEVIGKAKHGFGVPVGIWITSEPALRERVHSRLTSLGRRGIVRPDFIAELLRLHQSEHAVYYGALMWSLFMLEEWLLAHLP